MNAAAIGRFRDGAIVPLCRGRYARSMVGRAHLIPQGGTRSLCGERSPAWHSTSTQPVCLTCDAMARAAETEVANG